MLLIDAFCGAGGASMGYKMAGFDIVGVDINPQPNYPFEFIQMDAIEFLKECKADVIHVSPPCQAFTSMKSMPKAKEHKSLIEPVRNLLKEKGIPYIIENVVGAPLINPFMLCGTMFSLGLEDADLIRHRIFEVNWEIGLLPQCYHTKRAIGVYGNPGGSSKRDGLKFFTATQWAEAMGIDWMNAKELAQAIPPKYTKFIGERLIENGHL